MGNIQILDCTLRDGGYCNQWNFGQKNITRIVSGLVEANIDYIEMGFLTQKVTSYNINITKFDTIDKFEKFIPKNKRNKQFLCLMNYGEFDCTQLPQNNGNGIDGIRVAFHKKDMDGAMEVCKIIKDKGYKVFVQPMVSLNYTDEEFLKLICAANSIQPYAFYIVDSFGVMKRKDLNRLFFLVEHNLDGKIYIGYHSHNNMQLAYANAQMLADMKTGREIIIDSCILGMGRGAGNLNTELFVEYLNDNAGTSYSLAPLLRVIDEVINHFYEQEYWGYSLPNYLSARYNCHPNYAAYLDAKKKLTVENMNDIFSMMSEEKKNYFDKEYIEKLYLTYMSSGEADDMGILEFSERIKDKRVLIIAPGKSAEEEHIKIIQTAAEDDVISISVNCEYRFVDTDYIFVSNIRRYGELEEKVNKNIIVTSNIVTDSDVLKVKYESLLNSEPYVNDNAGMMLIQLLINLGVKQILLAGIDGYTNDADENFMEEQYKISTSKEWVENTNRGLSNVLQLFAKQIVIDFLTEPKYLKIKF